MYEMMVDVRKGHAETLWDSSDSSMEARQQQILQDCGCTFFKTHKATCQCTCKNACQYTGKAGRRKLLSVLQCAVQGGWSDICLSYVGKSNAIK